MARKQTNFARLGHVEALDGIRGLAVGGVMLLHYSWVSIGWVGVQVFFVLSGFLITSILVESRGRPIGASLKAFYWRRSLRVFPLYFGYVLALTIAYLWTGVPGEVAEAWPYLYSYTLNHWYALDRGLLGHLWSLSVEEQFYLLWPALALFLPMRWFKRLIILFIVCDPFVRMLVATEIHGTLENPTLVRAATYRLTLCQIDAFAIGAAVAVFGQTLRDRPRRSFLWLSLIVIAAGQLNALVSTGSLALDTSLGYDHDGIMSYGQYHWAYTLLDLWSAALIVVALEPNPISAVLSNPALAYIGKISYGMYVLHYVVQRQINAWFGTRHGLANLGKFSLYAAILVALASVSYRWFETPFLRLKNRVASEPR